MYCKKCGAGMEEDAVFCPKCGEKVDEAEENRTSTEGYTGAESGGKPDASGKSNKALIMAIALIVFLLLIIAVGGFFIVTKGREGRADRDRDGRAEKDAYSTIDGSGAVGENAVGDGETYTETKADVSVSVVGANEVGGLSGAEVILRNAEGETIAESETDSAGCASFEDVSSGGYTIACSADGYNARETELTVGATGNNAETSDSDGDGATNGDDSSDGVGVGTAIRIVIALAPEIVGDDACVLLVWEGDHDLDLCAFHSGLKEYVNIGHPVDSAGNIILYADHGADQPYELLYIHDISDEIAKSFYVIEAANARVGAASGMEADGVSVYVYDASGLVYFISADTGENAALWRPCYYYASSVYEEQQYIGDATGESYAWISFNEEDAFAADVEDQELLTVGHSGRNIVLTEADKTLLRAVAGVGLGGYYTQYSTGRMLTHSRITDEMKERMEDLVFRISSVCPSEEDRTYENEMYTMTTYDAALIEGKINELFHTDISIADYLPNSESALRDWSDWGYAGCYCRNGKIHIKMCFGEDGTGVSLIQQKYVNDVLVLIYGWCDEYGDYDVDTGEKIYRAYTGIYLWEADNALGYEIGMIQYEPAAADTASVMQSNDAAVWKTAYKNFLESGATPAELFGGGLEGYTFSECKYSLIYIDSDDIPEICITTPAAYFNWSLLTYQSGQVYSWGWNKGISYVPRSGKFVVSGGMMGHEDYTCYQISPSGIVSWKEGYVNSVDANLNYLDYGKEECWWDGKEIIGRDNFLSAMKADCGDGIELDVDAGISYSELMALLNGR